MRAILIVYIALLSGCKTAEIAVTHPMTGLHVTARIEAQDPAFIEHDNPASVPPVTTESKTASAPAADQGPLEF